MTAVPMQTGSDSPRGALWCCALQVCGSLAIAAVLYEVAVARSGPVGGTAALVAAAICGAAALATLSVTIGVRGPQRGLASVLAGMFLRLGVPVVAGLVLSQMYANLGAAGLFGWIVVAYLANLVLETTLSVWLIRRQSLARGER